MKRMQQLHTTHQQKMVRVAVIVEFVGTTLRQWCPWPWGEWSVAEVCRIRMRSRPDGPACCTVSSYVRHYDNARSRDVHFIGPSTPGHREKRSSAQRIIPRNIESTHAADRPACCTVPSYVSPLGQRVWLRHQVNFIGPSLHAGRPATGLGGE